MMIFSSRRMTGVMCLIQACNHPFPAGIDRPGSLPPWMKVFTLEELQVLMALTISCPNIFIKPGVGPHNPCFRRLQANLRSSTHGLASRHPSRPLGSLIPPGGVTHIQFPPAPRLFLVCAQWVHVAWPCSEAEVDIIRGIVQEVGDIYLCGGEINVPLPFLCFPFL